MKKADYIEKAKSLGIESPEDLSVKELQEKIKVAESKLQNTKVDEEEVKAKNPKEKDESSQEETQEEKKAKLLEKGIYLDDRNRAYKFTKDAPKKLNIDGAPMTQKEILETEEVISELVYGNNGFITQVNHEL